MMSPTVTSAKLSIQLCREHFCWSTYKTNKLPSLMEKGKQYVLSILNAKIFKYFIFLQAKFSFQRIQGPIANWAFGIYHCLRKFSLFLLPHKRFFLLLYLSGPKVFVGLNKVKRKVYWLYSNDKILTIF